MSLTAEMPPSAASSSASAPSLRATGPRSGPGPEEGRARDVDRPRPLGDVRPFRASALDVRERDVTVRGAVPGWLRGELVRTAPAVFDLPGWHARHWFDGLGMLYAFRFGPERVTYRSRLLESDTARAARDGRSPFGAFDTRIRRPWWRRLVQPVPPLTDNANVNLVALGDERVALTETPRQVVVDADSLESRGYVAYDDELPRAAPMTAHPQFDFARQRVVNAAQGLGPSPYIAFYDHAPRSRRREVFAKYRAKRLPYVHSFGLTPKHAVLVAHPFTVNPARLLWSDAGFVEAFEWRPGDGTRVAVYDRETGAERLHETDPMFVFHTVHAFEDGDDTVLDVLDWQTADVTSDLRVAALASGVPEVRARLVRLRLSGSGGRARREVLSDVKFEFPVVSYRRVEGKPERFVWGASVGPCHSPLVKVDLTDGSHREWSQANVVFGEPVFVARPEGTAEDDGVLLAVGSDLERDRAVLAVLDAASLELLAEVEVDLAVPLGFHGSFFRG